MNIRNILGSGKSKIEILTLDEVLMTPEQIAEQEKLEEERIEAERLKAERKPKVKHSKPKNNIIIPEVNLNNGDFKWYEGKNTEQMPEILKDNKVPMSASTLFLLRTGRLTDKDRNVSEYITNYFDTADLIAYSTGDEIKYVLTTDRENKPTELGLKALSWIKPETLVNNGTDLSNGKYEQLDGDGIIKVNRNELGEIETVLSLQEALDSKHWRILLRHEDEVPPEFAIPGLHDEYINWVFSEYKNQHAKDKKVDDLKLMEFYLGSAVNKPYLKAWYVYRLVDRSSACGRNYLFDDYGRLVGISARGANRAVQRSKR